MLATPAYQGEVRLTCEHNRRYTTDIEAKQHASTVVSTVSIAGRDARAGSVEIWEALHGRNERNELQRSNKYVSFTGVGE